MKKLALLIGGSLLLPSIAGASDGLEMAGSLGQMVGSLILVIGIILLLYYCAGRFMKLPQGGTPFRYIRVVETRHLAPKKSLMLVEVGGEYLLLSNTGEGVNFLKQVEVLEEIEILDDRGYSTLIPVGLKNKIKQMTTAGAPALGDLCLQKNKGGLA